MNSTDFDEFSEVQALKYARLFAGASFNIDMATVLKTVISNPQLMPKLRYSKTPINFKSYIEKWVGAYLKGYNNRPSVRKGKKSVVIADTLPGEILEMVLGGNVKSALIKQMSRGHAILMRIENLVGDFLEEYLAETLSRHGWSCCWGSTIDAVDFCNSSGNLLQVKNSDNSENSSSSRVRTGTKIIKWARRKSTAQDHFFWDELNTELGITELSERNFRKFISDKIKANPQCIDIT